MHPRRQTQREAIRLLGPDVAAVEPYLRDRAALSGLERVSPDVVQCDLGFRHRSRVVRAIEALAGIVLADGRPLLIYDRQTFVLYWSGFQAERPPNPSQTAARLRYARTLPDCHARQVMLQELAPFVRKFDADKMLPPAAVEEGAGTQQQLPLPGDQAGAPATTATPAPSTDATATAAAPAAEPAPQAVVASPATTPAPTAPAPIGRAGVQQLTAQLAGRMDPRAALVADDSRPWWLDSPAGPVVLAYRRHLAGLPPPDDRWLPGRSAHDMLLRRWAQAPEGSEWHRYFRWVAGQLDARGQVVVAGRPVIASFDSLLRQDVISVLWEASREVQRADTGADPPAAHAAA